MKKFSSCLLALVFVIIVISGCGSGGNSIVTGAPKTNLAVALSNTTPPQGGIIEPGTEDVPVAIIDFTASPDSATGTITAIKITKYGSASDSEIPSIRLYQGSTWFGTAQTYSSGTVTLVGFTITIAPGTTRSFRLCADIAEDALPGHTLALGIAATADITTTFSPTGTFPIVGNTMTIDNL